MKAIVVIPTVEAAVAFTAYPGEPVIGVNSAAGKFTCTHFVAGDLHVIQSVKPLGTPQRVFPRPVIERAMADEGVDLQASKQIEDLFKDYPRSGKNAAPWSAHSATMALVLAASLGATQIDVIGLDRNAPVDIEGAPIPPVAEGEAPAVRHDLIIFDQTVKFLADRGVVVSEVNSQELTVGGDVADEVDGDETNNDAA